MMRLSGVILVSLGLFACTGKKGPASSTEKPSLQTCQSDHFTCASLNPEDPQAQEAYQLGCEKKDYYACFRLGQLQEEKEKNVDAALKSYGAACMGKDFYGCRAEKELRSKLCYVEHKKQYCKAAPEGEERIVAFLSQADSPDKEVFVEYDFSQPFSMALTRRLYAQRIQEKSKQLLEALKYAKETGKQNGQSLEALSQEIQSFEVEKKAK